MPTWLRWRYDAYDVQREEAVQAGLVESGREEWLGFIPHRTHTVDPPRRDRVVAAGPRRRPPRRPQL